MPAADLSETRAECETCGAALLSTEGNCLRCFLGEGLKSEGEGSHHAFLSVLAEADVPDQQWRLGQYEILEEIGRGGMGVIYRARQRHSRRIVAVKRILAYQANSNETLVRFRREAEAVAALDHPNIVPIYEVSESEDGLPFFSMKYAVGGSLRAASTALRAKPRESVRLVAKVARAIAFAHEKGILHRDLQPGNILLDGNGEPLVSDFGLAKWLAGNSDLTRTLTTFGTPGYIAPEQAEGAADDVAPAADIYSLGAILFHLLTGRPPFVGANVLSVIHQAAATAAPRLRSLVPELDRDLETIVARCLEREAQARYQSAGALAEDLERWLAARPILARPISLGAQTRRWTRQHPLPAVAAMAGFLLVPAVLWLLQSRPAPVAVSDKSIAVLPFDNLSADPDIGWFATGVQDDILTAVGKIAELKVISRNSVMSYAAKTERDLREIGQALRVAHVLEGSVRRAGGKIRVTAQLIDTRTHSQLWAESYDRDLADVFAIQSEIARQIAAQLRAKLSPTEKAAIEQFPTSNLAAYDLYARARALNATTAFSARSDDNLLEAIRLLDQAVALDPSFFLAFCELTHTHSYLYFNGDQTPARRGAAERAVEAAIELRPGAGETHLAQADFYYRFFLDYERARTELALAQKALPNNVQVSELNAYIDRRQGRWEQSAGAFEKALELDPRNYQLLQQVSFSYNCLRRFPDMAAALDRALAVVPEDIGLRITRAWMEVGWKADTKPVHDTIEKILIARPAAAANLAEIQFFLALCERDFAVAARAVATLPPAGASFDSLSFPPVWCEGLIARARGDTAAAQKAFTSARGEIERKVREQPDLAPMLCLLGLTEAALGHKEAAIRAGERAVELLPLSKDAIAGHDMMRYLAAIYTWTGEKDRAIAQIAATLRLPGTLSYGQLRLHPLWDDLRGDPRFEEIVASLAPKE